MSSKEEIGQLRFTGNWFIDLGILGFVNLMEEVYGWELKSGTLEQNLKVRSADEITNKFLYAFFYKNIKDFRINKLNSVLPKELRDKFLKEFLLKLDNKHTQLRKRIFEFKDVKTSIRALNGFFEETLTSMFKSYNVTLDKNKKDVKKLLNQLFGETYFLGYNWFFTNFAIFNVSSSKKANEERLWEFVDNLIKSGSTRITAKDSNISNDRNLLKDLLDKTLSPFLNSITEFDNIQYVPFTLHQMESIIKDMTLGKIKIILLLLSFPNVFFQFSGKRWCFYSNSLEFTYDVNKKLRQKTELLKNKNQRDLLKETWSSVIDALVEHRSAFSLENMYLISFSGIKNQQISDVDYITIPRLQAQFLIDDIIRENLNKIVELQVSSGGTNRNVGRYYLVEFFSKGIPLTPVIAPDIRNYIASKDKKIKSISVSTSITAVALDEIYNFTNSRNVFSHPFDFNNENTPIKILRIIKSNINDAHRFRLIISELTKNMNQNFKKNVALNLLNLVLDENKRIAINTMIRVLLSSQSKDVNKIRSVVNFLIDALKSNSNTWKLFTIAFVLGLMGGGQK